jgi:hypothetical protein
MTFADLKDLWDERDRRYSMIRHPLTHEQIVAVQRWRFAEASELEVGRSAALARAIAWTPPKRKEPRITW